MMPQPLNELERRVLDYLIEYTRSNTYQPSIREIGREFAIKSTKTVSELLQSLADKGWIERDPSRSRGVRLLGVEMRGTFSVPLADPVEGDEPARFELDKRLVDASTGAFLATMRGSHLMEDCVRNGDLLLVEPADIDQLKTGDIVLARAGSETGVRRCIRNGTGVLLEPTRPEEVATSLTLEQAKSVIQGVVTTVVRRLRPFAQHAQAVAVAPTPR
jgi:repressor LexA